MNEQLIGDLFAEATRRMTGSSSKEFSEKFAELTVRECISILETEIELVKGYKSTAHNDFDVKWHDGKIAHFTKCKNMFLITP